MLALSMPLPVSSFRSAFLAVILLERIPAFKKRSDCMLHTKKSLPKSCERKHFIILCILFFGYLLLLFAGCVILSTDVQTPTAGASESIQNELSPHVSPYFDIEVSDVQIRHLENNSNHQVEITIIGNLPDQCEYDFYTVENRNGQNINITLKAIHPSVACKQETQIIKYDLILGRDMPEGERGFSPGNYVLIVNNFRSTFQIEE